MSLVDCTKVDIVMKLPDAPGGGALVICDGGEILDVDEREKAFLRKLSYYLKFITSGEFGKAYPALSGGALSIEVVCTVPPTDGMKQIEGLRAPDLPNMFLPVNVLDVAEFDAKFGLTPG